MTQNNNQEEVLNIRDIFFHYLSYWKWITLSLIIFISIGAFYLLKTNNQYEIKTSILIKEDDSGMSELAILDDLGLTSGKNNIDNEIEILKSTDLIKNTIYATNFHTEYSKKIGFKSVVLHKDNPISLEIKNVLLDTLNGNLDFSVSKTDGAYLIKAKYINESWERKALKLPALLQFPFGKVYIELKNTAYKFDDDIFVQVQNPEKLAVSLSEIIKVTPTSKKSSVIEISLNGENVDREKALLAKLVDIYNLQMVEDKNQIALNTGLFIDDRLKSLSVELSNVEQDVEQFKTTNKITDISSEAKLFLDQTGSNEEKSKEVETQLNVINYVEAYIINEKNKDRLIPNLGITDEGLAALINKYNELSLEKERIQRTSTNTNPIIINLINQLNNMRLGIRNSIISVRKTLSIAKKDLDREGQLTTSKIEKIPHIERKFIEIKRQQQIKETLYLFLLQKREETNLSLAATAPKAKVISQPRAENNPISPKKSIILLISLLLGIITPVIVVYIRDLFHTEIKDREELEKLSEAPILAEIPKNKEDKLIVVGLNDTSSMTELFRSLRNDLSFILSDPTKKTITITSTVSGEGKTFIAANLACTFAMIDKKVLLVGLDIRNPSLPLYLGLEKKQGLTSYLAKGGDLNDLIEKSILSPNLDVIQAGIVPPNPNELLNKQELDDLFLELRNRYDYIIIDTAPVGIISDTFLVNRISDITLYVTRENITNKGSLLFLNDLFNNNRLTNIYVVLNDTNIEKKQYGYQNRYNYGYRKEVKKERYSFSTVKNFVKKQQK